jgi:hypothetical protein
VRDNSMPIGRGYGRTRLGSSRRRRAPNHEWPPPESATSVVMAAAGDGYFHRRGRCGYTIEHAFDVNNARLLNERGKHQPSGVCFLTDARQHQSQSAARCQERASQPRALRSSTIHGIGQVNALRRAVAAIHAATKDIVAPRDRRHVPPTHLIESFNHCARRATQQHARASARSSGLSHPKPSPD